MPGRISALLAVVSCIQTERVCDIPGAAGRCVPPHSDVRADCMPAPVITHGGRWTGRRAGPAPSHSDPPPPAPMVT